MNTAVEWLMSWTFNGKFALIFFFPLALLLFYSSLRLVKWADVIIHKTRFGGGFIGGTLIATVTSFPELITEITQASSGLPENGLGDDIGSNAFSIFLIAVGGVIFIRSLFLNKLDRWTKISLGISFVLTAFLSIMLLINRIYGIADIPGGVIGIVPAIFFIVYIATIFLSLKFGHQDPPNENVINNKKVTVKKAIIYFTISSIFLIVFATLLNIDTIAFQNGFGIAPESIGGVFLAIVTSMPEVVAFYAFMRKNQPIAAISSLIGSHFFNLGILFFGDLAYSAGPTFNVQALSHHLPLAIITAGMILLFIIHFTLARKFSRWFEKRWVYLIIPIIIIIGYIVGWAMILTFNSV